MRSHRARAIALLALCSSAIASSVAHAQTTTVSAQDAAVRRQLIDDAQRATQAGNHEQAFNLAERASQIEMTPSLRLFLAQEANALHRHVVAIGHADLCLREVGTMAAVNNRARIIEACTAAQTTARASIGRVLVRVPTPTPAGASVTINGTALNPATWGVATPVDPGTIRVAASANGQENFEFEVNVASGQEQVVNVVFRPSASGTGNTGNTGTSNGGTTGTSGNTGQSTGSQGANGQGNSSGDPDSNVLRPPAPRRERRSNVGPIVVLGVGGALGAAAVVTSALYAVNVGKFDRACNGQPVPGGVRYCDPQAQAYENDVGLTGTLSWVFGGAAVATLAVGAVWMVMNNGANNQAEQRAVWVMPHVAQSQAGVLVGGSL